MLSATPSALADEDAFAAESQRTHFIADGDTLSSLARRYLGDPSRAAELFVWNRDVLSHPELLPIGVELRVEGPEAAGRTQPGMIPVDASEQHGAAAPRARLLSPQPAAPRAPGFAAAFPGPR